MLLPDQRIGRDREKGMPIFRPERPQLNKCLLDLAEDQLPSESRINTNNHEFKWLAGAVAAATWHRLP